MYINATCKQYKHTKTLLKVIKDNKNAQHIGNNKMRILTNMVSFNRKQKSRLSTMLGEEMFFLTNNVGVLSSA